MIDKIERVKQIHSSWNSTIHFEEVVNWILQFDSDDYDLAIRILEHINFFSFNDLKNALRIAYSKLIRKSIDKDAKITTRNTLFAGMGENGKSGSMISYHFRVINELSEENFYENEGLIENGKIENIVLIDDILSTGRQASNEILELTEKVTPYGVNNIFLLTVCGMKEGIRKVEEETKAYTFSAIEYSIKDTVIDLDSNFYKGLTYKQSQEYKEKIAYYGKIANPKQPLGYGAVGSLIAFDFNTPNNSLPLIWSDTNSWIPLFKRARRINGINSYYKQFEKGKKDKNDSSSDIKELTVYVEGKSDEIFFDLLNKEKNLAKAIGFEKIHIVSLGGAISSEKLINKLKSKDSDYLFILENDIFINHALERISYDKFYIMKPNIVGLLNIEQLLLDKLLIQPDLFNNEIKIEENIYFEIESEIIKRTPPSKRQNIIQELISKYFDDNMFNQFVEDLKAILTK